jgi:hypothetical protein
MTRPGLSESPSLIAVPRRTATTRSCLCPTEGASVDASFTKFQALVGPWGHVAEGAYHQLVAG